MRKAVLGFLMILVAVPVMAQRSGAPAPPPANNAAVGGGAPPEAILKEILQLTDSQLSALGSLEDSRRQTVEPIAKQLPDAQHAVETAVNASSPDACAVGAAVLRVHSLQQQVEQAQKTFAEGFNGLLTDAQRAQLQQIHGVEAALHAAEALHALGL